MPGGGTGHADHSLHKLAGLRPCIRENPDLPAFSGDAMSVDREAEVMSFDRKSGRSARVGVPQDGGRTGRSGTRTAIVGPMSIHSSRIVGILSTCFVLFGGGTVFGQSPASGTKKAEKVTTDGPGHRFGRVEPIAKPKDAIRVCSYNVLNLFDPFDDPDLQGEYDDLAMATPRERCEAIAKAIRAVDADVLCLQEVEGEDALRWFRDEFLADQGYDHIVSRDVGYDRAWNRVF